MPLSSFSAAGTITEDGRLELASRRDFTRLLASMRRGPVTVDVAVARAKHSQKARGYYWGVVLKLISEHTGYDVNELHELFKRRFTQPVIKEVLGEEIEVWTTAEDDSLEFYTYVEDCRRVGAEMGVETPDPDANWKAKADKERAERIAAQVDAALSGARL
jgi:hypothetical protein